MWPASCGRQCPTPRSPDRWRPAAEWWWTVRRSSWGLGAAGATAGPSFGGENEAITVPGALDAGFTADGWDGAIAGPGPGILGSTTRLGHGGLAALDTAHASLALGCRTLLVPRMSEADPRERHRGLSHHSATVLEMLLAPVLVPFPEGAQADAGRHECADFAVDLQDRKSTRLNSSHLVISYAVFCLKKKKTLENCSALSVE